MAFTNLIPQLWSARLLFKLRDMMVWPQLTWDLSNEIPDGDRINLGFLTGSVTVSDYTVGTDMSDPQTIGDAKLTLNVDQQKAWSLYFDDIDQIQARPPIVDRGAAMAAQDLAVVIQDFIRGKHAASGTKLKTIAATNKAFDTSAKRALITDAMLDFREDLDALNVPRGSRYCVVSPKIATYLLQTVDDRGLSLDSEISQMRRGNLMNIWDFDVYVDPGAQSETTPTLRLGVRGNDIYFAMQIRETEAIRHQKRFGDILRGLAVYGAVAQYSDLDYMRQIQLAQS